MISIKVEDMRSAGKPGYVARVTNGERIFLQAVSQDKYSSSKVTKTYTIEEDGIYEICDANFGGRKRNIKFIKVENLEIVQEEELLSNILTTSNNNIVLPDLVGSIKQIDWATNIRNKFITQLQKQNKPIPEWVIITTSAKYYIDYRDKLE